MSSAAAKAAIAAMQLARRTGARQSAGVVIKDESIFHEVDDAAYQRLVAERRKESPLGGRKYTLPPRVKVDRHFTKCQPYR